MKYIKFLVVPLLFVTLAFMNIGGCSGNSSGGKNKEGCCVVEAGEFGLICIDDLNRDECDIADGELKKGKLCENVPACDIVVVTGCCVVGNNDCDEDLTLLECDFDGGVLSEDVMCDDVPQCNIPIGSGCCELEPGNCKEDLGIEGCADEGGMFTPLVMCSTIKTCEPLVGAGCCVIGEGNCKEGLGIKGCADEMGMFEGGVMCVDILECVVPPLVGSILYEENCQGCHGVDGAGGPFSNVQGKSADQIDAAIANPEIIPTMMGLSTLTAEEVDAIAAFLGVL